MSIAEQNPAQIATELLTPTIVTEVFVDRPDAHFWLGLIASGATVAMPVEYQAAGVFRANVYIDENRFLPDSARRSDGSEADGDDNRSVHFVILENQIASSGLTRLVGT